MIDTKNAPGGLIIFSFAATVTHASVSEANRAELQAHYEGLAADRIGKPLCTLSGCYEGERETSYIVPWADYIKLSQSRLIKSVLASEKTILVLYDSDKDARGRRRAALVEPISNAPVQELGYFGSVSEAFAKAQNAWTFDGNNYFVAMPSSDWQKLERLQETGFDASTRPDWRELVLAWHNPANLKQEA